ncbi:MAG: N-6 DNA methylase [Myxococcaceae bacterium]|nr:N-6 DNA methylase [Myxococcaceae bacterium]
MPSTHRLSAQQRRTALEQLGRDRLLSLTAHFSLEVADKRVAENHISALLRARGVDFSELLGLLSRQELQSICDALGLDRGGREKELLVQRILGFGEPPQAELPLAEAAAEQAPTSKPQAGRTKAPKQGGDLGFEATLWQAADKLRNNMDAAEYKHVVLGLIFLKYISDAFEERRAQLLAEVDQGADPEHPDEYRAENIFWVPKEARWARIQAQARQPSIGKLIDDAMVAIERDNPSLKGVLPKEYARPGLDKQRLGELIDLIGTIGLGNRENRSKDILGRVYEYFLSEFASAEGKKGGQFYTPRSIVKLLVEMLAPYRGRVYDPCCGSGGMFIQSEKFVEAHGGKLGDISIFGQESNPTTWKLAKMNLAIRGIDANLGPENADSFHRDQHKDLKADYILANPPFNDSDWGSDRLREDGRWKFALPPAGNANFAWVQHFIHHLAPTGTAGFVLANGSMSSNTSGEGEIRRAIIEADIVDCMVALPSQLFYSTQIPVCLWFLARNKKNNRLRDRRGEILFIDARKLGRMINRTQRELSDEDIRKIADTYYAWRTNQAAGNYVDVPAFCKAVQLEEVAAQGFVLTPSRYVGTENIGDESEPLESRMKLLTAQLRDQMTEANSLEQILRERLRSIGYVV